MSILLFTGASEENLRPHDERKQAPLAPFLTAIREIPFRQAHRAVVEMPDVFEPDTATQALSGVQAAEIEMPFCPARKKAHESLVSIAKRRRDFFPELKAAASDAGSHRNMHRSRIGAKSVGKGTDRMANDIAPGAFPARMNGRDRRLAPDQHRKAVRRKDTDGQAPFSRYEGIPIPLVSRLRISRDFMDGVAVNLRGPEWGFQSRMENDIKALPGRFSHVTMLPVKAEVSVSAL